MSNLADEENRADWQRERPDDDRHVGFDPREWLNETEADFDAFMQDREETRAKEDRRKREGTWPDE